MAEWLLHQLFFLFNAVGAFAFFFLFAFTIAAIWGWLRNERYKYTEAMSAHWSVHIALWLVSLFSTASMTQSPDEFEINWSLSRFEYDEFISALEFSFVVHIVMVAIVVARLKFNSPERNQ